MGSKDTIETLNALSLTDFRAQLWPSNTLIRPSNPESAPPLQLTLESSTSIPPPDLAACFQLIKETSSKQYAASSLGWHPHQKRQEMRLLDLKYVLLKHDNKSGNLDGFMSFMLTQEDGIEVIYCYEIHLAERCRGMGLGRWLIGCLEEVGRRAGVGKVMLTVFRSNEVARAFYERLGYGEDEYSPRPRRLRGGVVKEVDYMILSKSLVTDRIEMNGQGASANDDTVVLEEENDALKHCDSQKREAG